MNNVENFEHNISSNTYMQCITANSFEPAT